MDIICNPDVFSGRAFPGGGEPTCFVIMPFKKKTVAEQRMQDVYTYHVKPVAEKCGYRCVRADDEAYFYRGKMIMERVWEAICTADIIIGEFTASNPNVTYEAGIAHTIGKPLIGIVQDVRRLPFDHRHLDFIPYTDTHDGLDKLEHDLEIAILKYKESAGVRRQYPRPGIAARRTLPARAAAGQKPKAQPENAEAYKKLAAAHKKRRTEVFISYTHKDKDYLDELRTHLRASKKIAWWDDTQIRPGEVWGDKIRQALSRAGIFVLLVSANYFSSGYIWNDEFRQILRAAQKNGVTILWLPVSYCVYKDTDVAKYQPVTDPEKPLTTRTRAERDEVYTALVERIREINAE